MRTKSAYEKEEDREKADLTLRELRGGLMMTNLDGEDMVLLRDAKKDDLETTINHNRKQADAMLILSRWWELILQGLPKGKAVGEFYTETKLRTLAEKAKRGK